MKTLKPLLILLAAVVLVPVAWAEEPPEFLLMWGTFGSGDGQFRSPDGVAVNARGQVFVTDSQNHRIQKFTGKGAFLTKFGMGQLTFPDGLGVGASSEVYVADTGNHRIQKFDSDGGFLLKWGSNGFGDGQFNFPIGVAIDASGNVYVADKDNQRIQKFDGNG